MKGNVSAIYKQLLSQLYSLFMQILSQKHLCRLFIALAVIVLAPFCATFVTLSMATFYMFRHLYVACGHFTLSFGHFAASCVSVADSPSPASSEDNEATEPLYSPTYDCRVESMSATGNRVESISRHRPETVALN